MKSFLEIVNILKKRFLIDSDIKFAKLIGLSPQNLYYKLQENSIPYRNIIQFCAENDISIDEIFLDKSSDKIIDKLGKKLIKSLLFLEKEKPEIFKNICIEIYGKVEWLKDQETDDFSDKKRDDNRKKLIHAMIYFIQNTKFCGLTKLMKLLYFLDFIHFRESSLSVTGLNYYAWQNGPVPNSLYKELKSENKPADIQEAFTITDKNDKSFIKINPIIEFDPSYFSKRELKLLNKISLYFHDHKAEEIVEVTHLPKSPWAKTIEKLGEDKIIDYMLAVDGKHGLPKHEIIARFEERRRRDRE